MLDSFSLFVIDSRYQKSIVNRLSGGTDMDCYKLGVVESHFAELIWQHEPLTSGELVKLCEQELQWKKSTTYTVLKKLCAHGISPLSPTSNTVTKREKLSPSGTVIKKLSISFRLFSFLIFVSVRATKLVLSHRRLFLLYIAKYPANGCIYSTNLSLPFCAVPI